MPLQALAVPLAAAALVVLSAHLPLLSSRFAEIMSRDRPAEADESHAAQERGAALVTDWM